MSDTDIVGTLNVIKNTDREAEAIWKIPNFLSLKDLYAADSYITFLCVRWDLIIEPYESDSKDYIALHLKLCEEATCYVKSTFGIKKSDDSVIEVISFKNTFSDLNPLLVVHKFFPRIALSCYKSELMPSNELAIVCKLEKLEGGPVKENPVKKNSVELTATGKDLLLENIKNLLIDETFCDITLFVKNKEFKSHKNILAVRSPVFAAMFKHETSEKQTGIVNISDCDPESFQKFLEYLYCGNIADLSFGSALSLYKTAHKYDVQDLKTICAEHLKQNLKAENVFDAVVLADEYEEKELQDTVQNFFSKNFEKVLVTTGWKKLMKNNFNLGNKLLINMASNVIVFENATVEIR